MSDSSQVEASFNSTPVAVSSSSVTGMKLYVDSQGQLIVQDSMGNQWINVRPVRLFPLSQPDRWISLIDSAGREIVCIDDPAQLGQSQKNVLIGELERREFVPIVKRIISVSGNSEPCQWQVETDRGLTSFILKDENDVRRLGDHSVLVVDSYSIRYLIPDRKTLDAHSRRIIEWYV